MTLIDIKDSFCQLTYVHFAWRIVTLLTSLQFAEFLLKTLGFSHFPSLLNVILKSINSLPPQNVHNGQAEYGFLFEESHGIKSCVIVGSNVMTWSKIQVLKKSHCTQQCKNILRDTWKKKSPGNKFLFIGILIFFNLITKKIAICIAHLVGLVTCPAENTGHDRD